MIVTAHDGYCKYDHAKKKHAGMAVGRTMHMAVRGRRKGAWAHMCACVCDCLARVS